MLTQKEPPPRSAGPTEHSGAFDEPGTRLRDYSGPFADQKSSASTRLPTKPPPPPPEPDKS